MVHKIWLEHSSYLESDVWKCPDAPINPAISLQVSSGTGAHYWKGLSQFVHIVGYFRCIHCKEIRWYPSNYQQAIKMAKSADYSVEEMEEELNKMEAT
ncbi:hypothetical protein LCGC14_0392980 [marine sediment metagenome]|uniref:Uncharacterized protein n=1 Tax=marine sediment metagenome TaxID=412755 RepID=A0A0F9TH29_9ZZZZ